MAAIRDLLNPLPEAPLAPPNREMPIQPPLITPQASLASTRKVKLPKDAAVFRLGKTQGPVRYPPCEERDAHLRSIHEQFELFPMESMASYPRTIPYQSNKKAFQERTGRDSFQVFQYTFKIPKTHNIWTVMWDYNIGLVRITHLFKANMYPKTAPGRMLRNNEGLSEICHSITGGALAAQGYWMPYEAARAIAATFCWDIRHVLTPLFGTDFPAMCAEPGSKEYDSMRISKDIIARAKQTMELYRSLEPNKKECPNQEEASVSPALSNSDKRPREVLNSTGAEELRPVRQIHPKITRRNYADSVDSARDSSTEPYCHSPQSPSVHSFTPVNAPRSSGTAPAWSVPSPQVFLDCVARRRKAKKDGVDNSEDETDRSSNSQADYLSLGFREYGTNDEDEATDSPGFAGTSDSDPDDTLEGDGDDDDDNDEDYRESGRRAEKNETLDTNGQPKKNPLRSARDRAGTRAPVSGTFAREVKAAHALLHLHMQEATTNGPDSDKLMTDVALGPPLGVRSPKTLQRECKKRRASF